MRLRSDIVLGRLALIGRRRPSLAAGDRRNVDRLALNIAGHDALAATRQVHDLLLLGPALRARKGRDADGAALSVKDQRPLAHLPASPRDQALLGGRGGALRRGENRIAVAVESDDPGLAAIVVNVGLSRRTRLRALDGNSLVSPVRLQRGKNEPTAEHRAELGASGVCRALARIFCARFGVYARGVACAPDGARRRGAARIEPARNAQRVAGDDGGIVRRAGEDCAAVILADALGDLRRGSSGEKRSQRFFARNQSVVDGLVVRTDDPWFAAR